MRLASLLLAVLCATARAQPAPPSIARPGAAGPRSGAQAAAEVDAARTALAAQLAEEQKTIDKTIATVAEKLAAADQVRLARLRAAYRRLRAPLRASASPAERMAAARRRAAARLLVDRDNAERGLLADEAQQLEEARQRIAADAQQVPTITLPADLVRPAQGTVAREFGTLAHDRSRATLSRRGIDLEVETRANVVAPADGKVRYAGPIRGLDDGVIIDHGDYFTVVAKLADLIVPVGATIKRGDRIGHAARYRVYLEVRVKIGPGGLPIDPAPLFEKPKKKAR